MNIWIGLILYYLFIILIRFSPRSRRDFSQLSPDRALKPLLPLEVQSYPISHSRFKPCFSASLYATFRGSSRREISTLSVHPFFTSTSITAMRSVSSVLSSSRGETKPVYFLWPTINVCGCVGSTNRRDFPLEGRLAVQTRP